MHRLVDDILMAYADGALHDEQKALVAEALARNPEAQRRLAVFRLTRDLARLAYDVPMAAPPRAMVETITGGRTRAERTPRIRSIGRGFAAWISTERTAIAMTAMLVGFVVGLIIVLGSTALRPARSAAEGTLRVACGLPRKDVNVFGKTHGQWCLDLDGLKVN